jgi:hypothetical protein
LGRSQEICQAINPDSLGSIRLPKDDDRPSQTLAMPGLARDNGKNHVFDRGERQETVDLP